MLNRMFKQKPAEITFRLGLDDPELTHGEALQLLSGGPTIADADPERAPFISDAREINCYFDRLESKLRQISRSSFQTTIVLTVPAKTASVSRVNSLRFIVVPVS